MQYINIEMRTNIKAAISETPNYSATANKRILVFGKGNESMNNLTLMI